MSKSQSDGPERVRRPIRLPGFINTDDVGLGDLIKQASYSLGIQPCGGCEKRAAMLNRAVVFSSKRSLQPE